MRCSLYIAKLRKNSEKTASFRKKFCLEMGVKPFLTDAVWRVQSGDLSGLRPAVCQGYVWLLVRVTSGGLSGLRPVVCEGSVRRQS